MSKSIEIIVSRDGHTTVKTKGFQGPSCQEASRFLEEAIGDRAQEKLTSEFYHADPIQQRQQQRA